MVNGLTAAGTSQQQQLLYKAAVHPDQEQHPAFRHRSTAARRSSAVGFHSPKEAAASSYAYGAAASYPEDPAAANSRGFHSPRDQPQGQRGSFTSPRERLNERPPPPTRERGYGVAGPSRPLDPQHSERVTEPVRQGRDRGHPSESHASDQLVGQAEAVAIKSEEGGQPTDLSKSRNGII